MTEPVKPKRKYRSPRRSSQASDTRAAVLSAARELFIRNGWHKATIAAIARQAGVSAETIYSGFGTKTALLEAVVVTSARGLRPDIALMDQPGPRAALTAPDHSRQIALFAADIAEVLQGVAPLMAVVRAASEAQPDLKDLYIRLHRGRSHNLAMLVNSIAQHGPLRTDRDTAIANVSRLTSPELFLVIANLEGLSPSQYAAWLTESLNALLLP